MGIESTVLSLRDWLLPTADHLGGLIVFLLSLVMLSLAGLIGGYLLSAIRNGPFEAFYNVGKVVVESVPEFFSISFRRVCAMTWLAFQEAIRKKALFVFVFFLVIMLFAGWYITPGSAEPARLYMSLIFTLSKVLVLLLSVLITVFSLPQDIQSRTIYTIYTKPVLHWEIFLGRLFGYIGVSTIVLVAMGVCSYIFIVRGLQHTHQISEASVFKKDDGSWTARTTTQSGHYHNLPVDDDGNIIVDDQGYGVTERNNQHIHTFQQLEENGKAVYELSGPLDMLRARIRHGGKIRFLDRQGKVEAPRGISVGKEWNYFSYVEGQSFAAIVYTFEIDESLFVDDVLPFEFNLSVFRTYKGDIVSGIRGSYHFRHPDNENLRSEAIPFTANEESAQYYVPRALNNFTPNPDLPKVDLMKDLTNDKNQIELWIQCSERGQYFGAAENSVYIMKPQGSYAWNFFKSYLSMWFQVIMVVSFSLVFSTFLNGPVSGLATMISLGYGVFAKSVKDMVLSNLFPNSQVAERWFGGGPVESLVRLFNQKNVMVELGDASYVPIVKFIDRIFLNMINVFVHMVPDYSSLDSALYLIDGYAIPDVVILQQFLTVAGFFVALVCTGYFFLKTREIAA